MPQARIRGTGTLRLFLQTVLTAYESSKCQGRPVNDDKHLVPQKLEGSTHGSFMRNTSEDVTRMLRSEQELPGAAHRARSLATPFGGCFMVRYEHGSSLTAEGQSHVLANTSYRIAIKPCSRTQHLAEDREAPIAKHLHSCNT